MVNGASVCDCVGVIVPETVFVFDGVGVRETVAVGELTPTTTPPTSKPSVKLLAPHVVDGREKTHGSAHGAAWRKTG